MKRLTVDKTAREMSGVELAHNCMYARDRWARYRDFDKDMDLFDFIREFANAEKTELPADNEVVAEMLLDGLQYSIGNPFGRVALVYNLMWAMADLRERLKAYEDTGLTPEEIMDGRMLTGWIPVEERLPSTSGRFEVTIKGGKGKRYVEMCDFQKEAHPDWCWGGRYDTKNVIAWRARPVPYKGK